MDVLVCFALKEEAAAFQKMTAGKPDVSILLTGIGQQNTEKSVYDFLGRNSPTEIFTCGFAGGLNPDLKRGDVLFEIRNPKSEIRNQLLAAGAKPAKFFCADRIATTVTEKKEL